MGRGFCPIQTFCGQGRGRVLQMHKFALFGTKNFGFFEIYVVSAQEKGKGGQFFAILSGRRLCRFCRQRGREG